MLRSLNELDAEYLIKIQQKTRSEFLDKFFVRYTHLGDGGLLWIVLSLIMLCFKNTRYTSILMMFALFFTWLVNTVILKHFLQRIRPYEALDDVRLLIKMQRDTSFPSGHAASSIACATVIMLAYGGALGIVALILALLMAFSRIYVGVHYPLDVIVGSMVGFVMGILVYLIGSLF